jgi:hypothetical protein
MVPGLPLVTFVIIFVSSDHAVCHVFGKCHLLFPGYLIIYTDEYRMIYTSVSYMNIELILSCGTVLIS